MQIRFLAAVIGLAVLIAAVAAGYSLRHIP